MSLTPQDNARSSFSQANPSRHVFQPNLPNNLPTPSPSQARATYRPTQGGIRPPNHQSPYATPYTPNNGQAGPPRPNGMYLKRFCLSSMSQELTEHWLTLRSSRHGCN